MAEYLDGAVVGGLEKVPEAVRGYYEETEVDGEKIAIPRIKPVEVGKRHYALEDVAGLKRTNSELKTEKQRIADEAKAAAAKVKELEDAKTAAEAEAERQAIIGKGKAKDDKPTPDPDLEARLLKIEKTAKEKIDALEKAHKEQVDSLQGLLHQSTSVTAVDLALGEAKVKDEYKSLIREQMLKVVKTETVAGKPTAIVIDPADGEMRTKATSMDPLTPRELAEEMKKQYPSCFTTVETPTGSGAPPNHRPASKSALDSALPVSKWDRARKLAYIKEHGDEKYNELLQAEYKSPFGE